MEDPGIKPKLIDGAIRMAYEDSEDCCYYKWTRLPLNKNP